ncbi:hypothetical protein MUK42_35496 [Musa troglodytarum]|uniref:Uncharacterized protein n=1 Tax=Musa troglodytarum TaxID=320322 RepID=A0A9E7JXC3_9LILI|nr:hypothetical protein MUK42_35496 [Musa troglodytarum]
MILNFILGCDNKWLLVDNFFSSEYMAFANIYIKSVVDSMLVTLGQHWIPGSSFMPVRFLLKGFPANHLEALVLNKSSHLQLPIILEPVLNCKHSHRNEQKISTDFFCYT